MLDWLVTAFVLLVGMVVMVTGWIEYLFIAFLVYLFLSLVAMVALAVINSFKIKRL